MDLWSSTSSLTIQTTLGSSSVSLRSFLASLVVIQPHKTWNVTPESLVTAANFRTSKLLKAISILLQAETSLSRLVSTTVEISAFLDFIFSSNSALFFAMFKHSSLGNPLYCFGIGISSKWIFLKSFATSLNLSIGAKNTPYTYSDSTRQVKNISSMSGSK